MSNFDFLASYDRGLAKAGADAEECLYPYPNATVIALRYVAEKLAEETVIKRGLSVELRPNPFQRKPESPTFDDYLKAIRKGNAAPEAVVNHFYEVKTNGNAGAHDHNVTVLMAKKSLNAAYLVAVWFMQKVENTHITIPPFVMPAERKATEPRAAEAYARWKQLMESRRGKWAAGILAALGITWCWQVARDKEHRWDVALLNTVRIATIILVLALLVLPFYLLANGLTIWQTCEFFVKSIADKLSWNLYLIWAGALALVLPFLYTVRMALSWNSKNRRIGIILLILMCIGYNLMLYYATQDVAFLFGDGPGPHGIKYYASGEHGIEIYDRPGYSPDGQKLAPITPEIWRSYQIQTHGVGSPSLPVDPAKVDWFSYNGKPLLWYERFPDGKLTFYKHPGSSPMTSETLLPVTKELRMSWRASREPKPVKPATQADSLRSVLSPTASGGPGVLLLHYGGEDRRGADALGRHLVGVDTSAFRSNRLDSTGIGSRLYAGEVDLVRDALSITHLSSLVIAEVKIECAKKSSLDPDLLTCDLTCSARKYDAHGNSSGSTSVHGIGVSFNQEEAIDMAAQRASGDLIAFAKH